MTSELRRDSNKEHHSGAGYWAGHVGGGEEKGGKADDDKWAADIYPGAVFKRGSG